MELSEQYQSFKSNENEDEKQQLQIVEFIGMMKKFEILSKKSSKQQIEDTSSDLLASMFENEMQLIKNDWLHAIKRLNKHLENVLTNNGEIKGAIEKLKNTETMLRVPLEQQERFLDYLKECETNLKCLKENLSLYERFNLFLYLNSVNSNNFKMNENQFYEFYQNLQNEIDYFLRFYQKFANESKIIC